MDIKNFLDKVCGEIKYRPVRKGICEELKSHIQEIKEEYTNKDGNKVNTIEFIVDSFSFVDTKAEGGITQNQNTQPALEPTPSGYDGWTNIPDGIDEELPFN